jgi:lysophospholipase L1-like esterase
MRFKRYFILLLGIFIIAEILTRLFLFYNGSGFFREKRFISPWFTAYDSPSPAEKDGFLYFKRGEKTTRNPAENTIRIICLGGSTTVNKWTKSHYPGVLQDKLNRSYRNVKFEVLNAGADAFSVAHSFVNFSFRLLYYNPDCIIVYENINDLSANYFQEPVKTDYANKYLDNLFLAPECKLGAQRYFFGSRFLSAFMMSWNNFIFEKKALALRNSMDISEGKKIFRTNLTNIAVVAKANKVNMILGVQAACFKKAGKFSYIKREDFYEYNNIIKEVAQEQNLAAVDCFKALEENPEYFMDLVHYTELGIDKLSDTFYEKIKELYPDVAVQKI